MIARTLVLPSAVTSRMASFSHRGPDARDGSAGARKNCKTRSSKALVSPSTTWLASKPKPRTSMATRTIPTSIRLSTSLAARSRERRADMDLVHARRYEPQYQRGHLDVSCKEWDHSNPGFHLSRDRAKPALARLGTVRAAGNSARCD